MIDFSQEYVLTPNLESTSDPGVIFKNPAVGTQVQVNKLGDFLRENYAQPKRLEVLLSRLGGSEQEPPAGLRILIENFILVTAWDAKVLGHGLAGPAEETAIGRSLHLRELHKHEGVRYGLFGVPSNQGAENDCTSYAGPSLVRKAFANPLYFSHLSQSHQEATIAAHQGARGADFFGDLEFRRYYRAPLPGVADVGDIRIDRTAGLDQLGRRISLTVEQIAKAGKRPIAIGGDHSLTYFVVAKLLEFVPRLGILHFDAHHDLWPAADVTHLHHGNPFSLLRRKEGMVHIHQVGLRTFDGLPQAHVNQPQASLSYYSAFEVSRMSPEETFSGLPGDIPYYLSFDVDCLDPGVCRGTGTPMAGGLSYYKALELVDYAARSFDIVGADFVEIGTDGSDSSPLPDVVCRLLTAVFLGSAPFEDLRTHVGPPS